MPKSENLSSKNLTLERIRERTKNNFIPFAEKVGRRKEKTPQTVLCLSGGGLKGAFEVGALYYLTKHWRELNIVGVLGTSTGAINALTIAAKKDKAAELLADSYLEAKNTSSFFMETSEYHAFKMQLAAAGITIDLLKMDFDLPRELKELNNKDYPKQIRGLIDVLTILSFLTSKGETLTDAISKLNRVKGVINANPAFSRIEAKIAKDLEDGHLLPLRMYMVQYDDGDLYYMDESGHVFQDTSGQEVKYALGGRKDELIEGAKASSAIPFFFEPRRFERTGKGGVDYFIDGGVRETMPLKGAKEMLEQITGEHPKRIISIVCSLPYVSPMAKAPNPFSVVMRTLSVFQSESLINEIAPSNGFNDSIERVNIFSETPVISDASSLDLDRGSIRILMDDGYMSAWEAMNLKDPAEIEDDNEKNRVNAILENRKAITELRKKIWLKEKSINWKAPAIGPIPGAPDPSWRPNKDFIISVRKHKHELLELLETRVQKTGGDLSCLPEIKVNGKVVSTFKHWYTMFEHHTPDALVAHSLWSKSYPFTGTLKLTELSSKPIASWDK
ncbi:MAG: patatin-like phospholipase family protein [Ardenticatenaceae bacterium]|nr:patatin-like phospholipase family protein [Ardenticatenaceae bacterium]